MNKTWKTWTTVEVKFLRRNYEAMPTKDIASRLNRTPKAIRSAAIGLKLKKKIFPVWKDGKLRCTKCKRYKSVKCFHTDNYKISRKRCTNWCKKCCAVQQSNKPYDNTKQQKYTWKYMYGITPEDYHKMWLKQEGCCLICKQPENGRSLSVDHDHKTKVVRGLLCQKCNTMLGLAHDNIDILLSAVDYLGRK